VSIVIREARDADGKALCALIEPIFAEYEGVLFILEEMPELMVIATTFGDAGGTFWVAERDGELVGCVGWVPHGDGVELKKLYVAKTDRERGLGRQLVDRVEEAATKRGAAFVQLWSDSKFLPAHRFYRRRGYVRDGQTRTLEDLSDTIEFHFRKELSRTSASRPEGE